MYKKYFEREILAVIPIYHREMGNVVQVYYEEEVLTCNKTIRSFEKNWCKHYFLDRLEEKNYLRCNMGVKNNIPLIIDGKMYLQIKVRSVIGLNDGAYAFVDFNSVSHYNIEDRLYIFLKNKMKIPTIVCPHVLEGYLEQGVSLKSKLEEEKRLTLY